MVRITRLGPGLPLALLPFTVWGCDLGDTSTYTVDPNAITLKDSQAASGIYEVNGVTVQAANGRQRTVAGTIWLRVEGSRYAVGFELDTTVPGTEESTPAEVTGTGSGMIVGGIFTGTTAEEVSGTDPKTGGRLDGAGLKIVSTSRARFDESGLFEIHLQNSPVEGQDYSPSVTVLSGRRIESLPDVAAPFPDPNQSPSSLWK